MNTTIPDISKVKSIVKRKVKKLFSKSESDLKPYIAKGLMATLTACVFIPLFSSGFTAASIAIFLSGIGGNLAADLIFSFHEKHKKKESNDFNIELIEFLQKELQKSPELQDEINNVLNELEIYSFLEKLINNKNNQWMVPYFSSELKKVNVVNSSQHINISSKVGNIGPGAQVKVKGNIVNVGRDYIVNYYKSRGKKFIIFISLLIPIIFFIFILFINWPLPEKVKVDGGQYFYGKERSVGSLPTYWIDTTPVTNKQYKIFVDATGYPFPNHWKNGTYPPELVDHPIVNVNLKDAKSYAKWAKKRLPTKYEWEKACRGENGNVYPWGDEWKSGISNTKELGLGSTNAVGYYALNKSPYGCLEMVGNIWEWTTTPDSASSGFVFIMGGAFNQSKEVARCYDARSLPATLKLENLGFRCVSDVEL